LDFWRKIGAFLGWVNFVGFGAAGLLMPAGGHLAAEFGLFALADSFSVFFLRFSILEFNWMI